MHCMRAVSHIFRAHCHIHVYPPRTHTPALHRMRSVNAKLLVWCGVVWRGVVWCGVVRVVRVAQRVRVLHRRQSHDGVLRACLLPARLPAHLPHQAHTMLTPRTLLNAATCCPRRWGRRVALRPRRLCSPWKPPRGACRWVGCNCRGGCHTHTQTHTHTHTHHHAVLRVMGGVPRRSTAPVHRGAPPLPPSDQVPRTPTHAAQPQPHHRQAGGRGR